MTKAVKTILIADDDNDLRELIACALQSVSYDIVQASNGAQALAMFQTIMPDLIVLDGMMPQMTGMEACSAIRKCEGGEIVPIIMLTAMSRLEDKVNGFSCGADDYLTKPFHYEELQARVRALLRIRDLTLDLKQKNLELQQMQQRIIEQERQLAVSQLGGAAAHKLGQPLSAILLQCYVLESSIDMNSSAGESLTAIKADAKRMTDLLERLKLADASKSEQYADSEKIIALED